MDDIEEIGSFGKQTHAEKVAPFLGQSLALSVLFSAKHLCQVLDSIIAEFSV